MPDRQADQDDLGNPFGHWLTSLSTRDPVWGHKDVEQLLQIMEFPSVGASRLFRGGAKSSICHRSVRASNSLISFLLLTHKVRRAVNVIFSLYTH